MHDSLMRHCRNADTLDIAVGYFHVSGFNELRQSLAGIKQIRLIMGDETDRPTATQLKKGHDPMKSMREHVSEMLNSTPEGDSDTLMELYEYCKSGKMKVRLYVHNKFHAKAYILKNELDKYAFIGSSNLSRAGLGYEGGNVELNFLAKDVAHVDILSKWYETIWEKSAEYSDDLIRLMESTEPYARRQNDKEYVTPKELFKIMANELLDSEVESDHDMLAAFQKIGVINAQDKIRKFGGVIIADSVGLGKTYIGMELIRRAQTEGRSVLVVVPARVKNNWEREMRNFGSINHDGSSLQILTHEKLSRIDLHQDSDGKEWQGLRGCDYMLVDEAHRFKKHGIYANGTYSGNKNHANLMALKAERDVPCVLLTATPLNNTVYDLKYLVQLFTNESKMKNYNSDLDFSHFDDYKKLEEQIKKQQRAGRGELDAAEHKSVGDAVKGLKQKQEPHITGIVKILEEVMILRTRHDISNKYPGLTINGKPVSFQQTALRQMRCEFPSEYGPLYHGAYELLNGLNLPHISMREHSSPQSRSLYLMLLYKRLDSSIHSFVASLERLLDKDHDLLDMTKRVGWKKAVEGVGLDEDMGLDAYTTPRGDSAEHGDKKATAALCADMAMIGEFIKENVEPIRTAPGEYLDPKLKELQSKLDNESGKVLIFTEYVDTAKYLYERIHTHGREKDCVSGDDSLGTDRETEMKIKLFAPIANGYVPAKDEREIDVLITTNTLAEGVNLQDCRTAVNYDIPWNPMAIVQRVGRIDRIGNNTRAVMFNMLPDSRFDEYFLNLLATVSRKVDTITSILGNENPILTDKDDVSPKSFGEALLGMGEAESIEEYEKMGRNKIFKSVHAKEEKSTALLGIREVVDKLGLAKSNFRAYDRAMYCVVDAHRADRKGVFAMFRVYDEHNGDKLGTITIFRDDVSGVCREIEVENFLDFIPMHEYVWGRRRTSELDRPLQEIKKYFNDNHMQTIMKSFSRSMMGTRQTVPPAQSLVTYRLARIKNHESFGDVTEVSTLHEKFAGVVLLKPEGAILSSCFGGRGLRKKIHGMDSNKFIKTVSSFYERHVQNNPNYAAQRHPDNIKYRNICWGAFV